MANASLITRNLKVISDQTENIYKSIAVTGKRAAQISIKTKEELNSKLAEFASTVDNLEEIFENREQIEISKYYERMPKPSMVALEEFLNGEIMSRERTPDGDE